MSGSLKRKLIKFVSYIGNGIKHKFDFIILYFDWLISLKRKIIHEFMIHDLGKCIVKPFHPRKWHNGTSVFIAETSTGVKYFVKRSFNKKAIQAEAYFIKELMNVSEKTKVNVCKLIFISQDYKFLCEEFIDGKPLSDQKFVSSIQTQDKIMLLNKLCDLVCELQRRSIVHSDFTPKNILISQNNSIYLIDFEYSIVLKRNHFITITNNKSKLRNLGALYSMRNGVIDDGYSLMVISKYLVPDLLSCNYALWRRINLLIGQLQYDIYNDC